MGLLAVARPLPLIAVTAFLTGVATDIYRPASSAAVADLLPVADRTRGFALIYWAVNLGVSVSGVLGGLLAERGWWILFAADSATCVLFALVVARGVPETRPERAAGESGGFGPVLRDRLAVALAGMAFVSGVVYLQAYVALPLAMTRDGLSPAAYGLAYAVNPVTVLTVQPLTLRWLGARPVAWVYAGSSVVLGVGFGLTYFAHAVWAYAATVFVWTLGEVGYNAIGATIINTIAPARLRGRYNGLIGLAFGGAAMVAPLAGTWSLARGRLVVWGGCFVIDLVVAGFAVSLGKALQRRMLLARSEAAATA
jgi:MFS family permease